MRINNNSYQNQNNTKGYEQQEISCITSASLKLLLALQQITYPMCTGVCFLEYQSKRTSSGLLEIVTGCTVDLFPTLFFSGVSSSASLLHDLVTFSSSRFSLDCSHRKNKIVNTNRFRRTQAYHLERRIAFRHMCTTPFRSAVRQLLYNNDVILFTSPTHSVLHVRVRRSFTGFGGRCDGGRSW